MAARGSEFYLRVLILSLTSERYVQHDTTQQFFLHFGNSKTVQLNWSPIVKCLKLGYKVIKEK